MADLDFNRLRAALPPLGAASGGPTGELLRCLQFYGIDLRGEFPDAEQEVGWLESGGFRLAAYRWRMPAAKRQLLIVHGYLDHAGLYGHLLRFALRQGYSVAVFDLPGHGLSAGERASIRDFAHYRGAVEDVLQAAAMTGDEWDLIAQSAGGAAVMDMLQHRAEPPPPPPMLGERGGEADEGGRTEAGRGAGDGQSGRGTAERAAKASAIGRVVLLAPLVRTKSWFGVQAAHALSTGWLKSVPRHFGVNSGDAQFLQFQRRDPLQVKHIPVAWVGALRRWLPDFLRGTPSPHPILVVQGDADDTVDWRWNLRQIRRLFPHAEVFILPGGQHHLANETAALRGRYLEVAAAWLRRLN